MSYDFFIFIFIEILKHLSIIQSYQDYLLLEKKYSRHTLLGYSHDVIAFGQFIKEQFDDCELKDVNYSLIRSWIGSLIDQGISHQSVNRKVASLKSFYNYLLKTEQITASPLVKHKALKTPKIVQVPYSINEMKVLLDTIEYPDSFEGRRDRLIIELMYSTGMRRAELIDLELGGIDYFGKTIKVKGKRNKERIIPLLPELIDKIKKYLIEREQIVSIHSGSRLFLTKKGDKVYDTLVYRIINSYLSAITEKKKRSPHMLRHTFATHILNSGADLNSVKELLGHSSLASTQVYTHSSLAELKKAYQGAHPRNKKK